ncbi:SDR family NAD(P)-dependent oxidoreductase [Occultella aeris]|uniref:3-oxoacyl-[acyl-carrier-protein] reductase FabG n=1 Tax=Occultella aeris TaxID=2761496 RepID=A0A7M4DJW3_9MICO|nr:SDR family NAD(P)-dependent oxidoreductase [Occultella aeris]VZO37348.1 3-oxoacyl-[acyl-carrier-protein] reductase FabG [Occultella aeris]
MTRILITGSADGIGRETAQTLLDQSHDVVLHARTRGRASAVGLDGLGSDVVVGDLADADQVHDIANQLRQLAPVDVVIHNAGVIEGPSLLAVNVVAPYLLTTDLPTPSRWIALSSSMHRGGRTTVDGLDWSTSTGTSYSDTKLLVTTLAAAIARRWDDVIVSAVDPGWVRSRMGGASAPVSIKQGATTQTWLAVSDSPEATMSGRYWRDRRTEAPHPATHDSHLQQALLTALEQHTGSALPG